MQYKSLLQPLFLYGISTWGQACKSSLNKLVVLQKRALRSVFFQNSTQSAIPLFIETEILPVKSLYIYSVAQLMYDVNHNNIPSNVSNLFTYVKDIHSHNTRSSARDNFYTSYSRLNTQANSFSRVGVHIWNQIPATTKNLSKKSFQREIKSNLLNDLNINHYDIDITKIFK